MGTHKESLIVLLEVRMVPRKVKTHLLLHTNLPNITPTATNVHVVLRRCVVLTWVRDNRELVVACDIMK